MISERKRTANRANARASCGPRTAEGKARASRNAVKHGIAALAFRTGVVSPETEELAKLICGSDEAALGPAFGVAEAERLLARVYGVRTSLIEKHNLDIGVLPRSSAATATQSLLEELESLERYENLAFSRLKRSIRSFVEQLLQF